MQFVTDSEGSINNLEIKNFKSIRDVSIATSRVNIFFGKPNSGKSNLLEALTLFNVLQNKERRSIEPTRIRYNTLDNLFYDRDISKDISVSYKGNLACLCYYPGANSYFQLVNPSPAFIENKKDFFEQGLSFNDILNKQVVFPTSWDPLSYKSFFASLDEDGRSSTVHFAESIQKENPVRKYDFRDGLNYSNPFAAFLKPSGENLFTIVQDKPQIREFITTFFEEFNLDFLIDFSSKKFEIQKKEKGIVYKIPFELTPDTLRRMLFYIAAIYSNSNSTILFEEPEAHSFPPYIKELSELIKADETNNYFITTHSPYFINSLIEDSQSIKGLSFFYVYYEGYQTKIKKLSQQDLDILWNSSVDIFFNLDSLNK